MRWTPSAVRLGVLGVALATARPVSAQDTLQHLKDLYAAAAYEDALAVATRLDTVEADPQVDQYRVFCLVALGQFERRRARRRRGHQGASGLSARRRRRVTAYPGAVLEVRRRVGPAMVKAMYLDAKAALDRKDREGAIARFEEMLRLADDPDVKDEPSISELRLLGAGFLDLSRALAARQAGRLSGAGAGRGCVRRPRPPRQGRAVTPPLADPRGAAPVGARQMPPAASRSSAARSACGSTRKAE